MKEEIMEMMADILELSGNELSDNLDNCEIWDSLKKVEVIFAVEDEYDFAFDPEEIGAMKTPNDLIQLIQRKCNQENN